MQNLDLVAHPCGDPNRATQCRTWSVASNSRRIRDAAPKSHYTPPNQGVAPFSGPPCRTFLSFTAGRGHGGLVEGIAALLGPENGSHYRGVSQLQSNQSRYSVQLRTWTHSTNFCNTRGHTPTFSLRSCWIQDNIQEAFCATFPALSGTESRIAKRTIPRIAGLESPEIPQREAKKMSRIAAKYSRRKSIQNRHPNRILSMLKVARFESHDSNRTILNCSILDSESPIQCH